MFKIWGKIWKAPGTTSLSTWTYFWSCFGFLQLLFILLNLFKCTIQPYIHCRLSSLLLFLCSLVLLKLLNEIEGNKYTHMTLASPPTILSSIWKAKIYFIQDFHYCTVTQPFLAFYNLFYIHDIVPSNNSLTNEFYQKSES